MVSILKLARAGFSGGVAPAGSEVGPDSNDGCQRNERQNLRQEPHHAVRQKETRVFKIATSRGTLYEDGK